MSLMPQHYPIIDKLITALGETIE